MQNKEQEESKEGVGQKACAKRSRNFVKEEEEDVSLRPRANRSSTGFPLGVKEGKKEKAAVIGVLERN